MNSKVKGIDLSRPSGQAADEATLIRLSSANGLPEANKNFFTLPKEDFILSDNIRTKEGLDEASIDGLRQTIDAHGQFQPVLVSGRTEDGKWRIEEGQRRYLAIMRSAVVHTIDFKLDPSIAKDQRKRLLIQLVANNQSAKMGPIENAHAHQVALAECNNDRQELCEQLGISNSMLTLILGLAKAPRVVVEFVNRHHIGDTDAIYNLSKLHGTTPEKATEIMEAYDTNPEGFALRQVTKDALSNTRTKVPGAKAKAGDKDEVGVRGRAAKVDKIWVDESDKGGMTLTLVAKGVRHRFQLTDNAKTTLTSHFIPGIKTEGADQTKPEEEEET